MTTALELEKTYIIREFEALPDDGKRYELVSGKLVEKDFAGEDMPGANERHCRVASRLHIHLETYVLQHKLGEIYGSDARYATVPNTDTVRLPDVSFVQTSRVTKNVYTMSFAPDLAVEVVSPSNSFTEIETKVLEYHNAGAKLVWVIELELKKAYIYRYGSNQRQTLDLSDDLDGENIIPGFKLPVKTLFE